MALGWRQISRRMGNGAGRRTLFFFPILELFFLLFLSVLFFYAFMRDN